jgi:hypothetical protein
VRTAIAALISILWLASAALADTVELTDVLPGHPGVTYFDLMKLIVTDIEVDPPKPGLSRLGRWRSSTLSR